MASQISPKGLGSTASYDYRRHYEVEKDLAARLRNSTREERTYLYSSLYDELLQRVPDHPQLTAKYHAERRRREVEYVLYTLEPFLAPDTVYAEIGAGDCAVAMEVAKRVRQAYAVDVSSEITKGLRPPANFSLRISDGISIPVAGANLIFSNQLMEHLHPDDALDQLRNIYEALAANGRYLCITPSRLHGPHDVSKYYDKVASGFHLKEYTVSELAQLFRAVGFRSVHAYFRMRRTRALLPVCAVSGFEGILARMPFAARRRIGSMRGVSHLLGIQLLGIK